MVGIGWIPLVIGSDKLGVRVWKGTVISAGRHNNCLISCAKELFLLHVGELHCYTTVPGLGQDYAAHLGSYVCGLIVYSLLPLHICIHTLPPPTSTHSHTHTGVITRLSELPSGLWKTTIWHNGTNWPSIWDLSSMHIQYNRLIHMSVAACGCTADNVTP